VAARLEKIGEVASDQAAGPGDRHAKWTIRRVPAVELEIRFRGSMAIGEPSADPAPDGAAREKITHDAERHPVIDLVLQAASEALRCYLTLVDPAPERTSHLNIAKTAAHDHFLGFSNPFE
jgi:hypothetical protein